MKYFTLDPNERLYIYICLNDLLLCWLFVWHCPYCSSVKALFVIQHGNTSDHLYIICVLRFSCTFGCLDLGLHMNTTLQIQILFMYSWKDKLGVLVHTCYWEKHKMLWKKKHCLYTTLIYIYKAYSP